MINSARHVDLAVGHTEVESSVPQMFRSPPRERGGDVRLVRCLVAAETRVPIDSEERLFRIGDKGWRELYQLGVDGRHKFQHRIFGMLLKQMLARLKPLAAIVAFQLPEELHHLDRKPRKNGCHWPLLHN